jgi:hypothetical protein
MRREMWRAKVQAREIGLLISGALGGVPAMTEPEKPTGKYARVSAGKLLGEMGVKLGGKTG